MSRRAARGRAAWATCSLVWGALVLSSAAMHAQPSDPPEGAAPAPEVITLATTSASGRYGRVDLVDGGVPASDPGAAVAPNPGKRAFLRRLTSFREAAGRGAYESLGGNLDADLADTDGDGIPDAGFDAYEVGLAPLADPRHEARIVGANNLYDLIQTTHGAPDVDKLVPGFSAFTGGDIDGDALDDGGPGLFSNAVDSAYPRVPPLPHVMGAGRGGQPGEQHQFVQLVFADDIDLDSVFDVAADATSFLDAQSAVIEARWVERGPGTSVVDMTSAHRHVGVVAVIGGVCALPVAPGSDVHARIDPADAALSGVPLGARERVFEANVLTLIAHESAAALVSNPDGSAQGYVDDRGILRLPDAGSGAIGGRVFGSNAAVPDAVNDFGDAGDALAARIGFVSLRIASLLTAGGDALHDVYFHSFEVSQAGVGADPAAPAGGFSRGPAIEVDALSGLPDIRALSDGASSRGRGDDLVSVHARFRVDFDKEVVPNSVGFSRRHTIHSVTGKGVVFPFNGNTRPVSSPAAEFVPAAQGAPLAASVFLAVNQPAQVAVNNPFVKDSDGDGLLDDGRTPIDPTATTQQARDALNGLYPGVANQAATLPRAVVPCDIYPVNQNNLQAYIVEPLVELPPGAVVTLGVCLPGLGTTALALTNRGNFTHSGTVFTPWQGLTPVGLGDPAVSLKTELLANETVIKVNAGPMDLAGKTFYGGTTVALDTLIDGDPANDASTGGTNVARSFQVEVAGSTPYVNAPVSPEALYAAFATHGAGVLDLDGRGLTTNAPGGSLENPELPFQLISSRRLEPSVSGSASPQNWNPQGAFASGDHQRAFGVTSRHTSGGCECEGESVESELAVGAAVPTGSLTPVPGVNEGSSGVDTFVRNSLGRPTLTAPEVGEIGDMVVGEFLDAVFVDVENPWITGPSHRSANAPSTPLTRNTIADPPVPNPPPLTFPVGLPFTSVVFDQSRLDLAPRLITGAEVFTRDARLQLDTGAELVVGPLVNALIHLNATINPSNPNSFDLPASLVGAPVPSPFLGEEGSASQFHQTGPIDKWSTDAATFLTSLNAQSPGSAEPGQLVGPVYQSRQQVGNFLFVTDLTHGVLRALNSNTMEVIATLALPDPHGLGLSRTFDRLYVSNRADDSLSVVDADPRSATFFTELTRVSVGQGPTAVALAPEGDDLFVVNTDGNTISIVDTNSATVRKTLSSPLLDEPTDICLGPREEPGLGAFQSGTYHGFIANAGGDNVLVYESGPSGVAAIGFDDILGAVTAEPGPFAFAPLVRPTRVVFDPAAPLDAFHTTYGCFVVHQDEAGEAMVSRIAYTQDSNPGVQLVDTTGTRPGFRGKTFEIIQQFATGLPGRGLDVALPDFDRQAVIKGDFLLGPAFNLGGPLLPGFKSPVSFVPTPVGDLVRPRWQPSQVYASVAGHGVVVFDINTGVLLKTVGAPADVNVLASFFSQ